MRTNPKKQSLDQGDSQAPRCKPVRVAKSLVSEPLVPSLWDELSAFPASHIDDALIHLMRWFREHLDVDNVFWFGLIIMLDKPAAAEDPVFGWRLRARRTLLPDTEYYKKLVASYYATEHYGKLTSSYLSGKNRPDTDLHLGATSLGIAKSAGKFRAYRLRDGWIDYPTFRHSEHYRLYYSNLGVTDRIWVAFPLNDHTESLFLLDRHQRKDGRPRRNFTDRDTAFAANVLYGHREFHRRLLLSNGVFRGVKALSPLKRRILQELLSSRSEKEIAVTLDQRPATLRKTITELYGEFGVKTRPALMALWLGEE